MEPRWNSMLPLALIGCLAAACSPGESKPVEESIMSIHLTSSAFDEGQPVPKKHTCDDRDMSPPLKWSGAPASTVSFALIADDPDAPMGTWVHWVLYDVPANARELPENVERSQYLPGGARQGLNDFRRLGYGGPCPPPGKPHRYFFKLYALDKMLDLMPGATRDDVLRAMEGHVLAAGQLMGTYQRE